MGVGVKETNSSYKVSGGPYTLLPGWLPGSTTLGWGDGGELGEHSRPVLLRPVYPQTCCFCL